VTRYTGHQFPVADLTALASTSQLLVILDGFDEVADTMLRNRIVGEVSDAAARLSETALGVQFIVTSRPAAFANSPGFPREEWQHLQLLPLSRTVIQRYAEKWLDGRGSDPRERRDILAVLEEKLHQPHVRDLARNPMQLAILLALISVQGASLPDKRTALYDRYIDIFMNREAEKSRVVRDHRELLIQIHRYIAWLLQGEAETSGAGNISETRLKDVLRHFLEDAGHCADLIDQLFTGIVERVVALVSRVQGTFEFEVQPLREYFAARYLYDTAQYNPPGAQRRGALPDRFDAIARNFYWLNVARFYAGCYSSGELASLIDGLEELRASAHFRYISHPTQLGFTLLSDHVFSQSLKLTARLATFIVEVNNLLILLATRVTRRPDPGLPLPLGNARTIFVERIKNLLASTRAFDVRYAAAQMLRSNLTANELTEIWEGLRITIGDDSAWLSIGIYLNVLSSYPTASLRDLATELDPSKMWSLLHAERHDVLDSDERLADRLLFDVLDRGEDAAPYYRHDRHPLSRKLRLIMYMSALSSSFPWCDAEEFERNLPPSAPSRRGSVSCA
jgi:hypothetical protein